VAKWSNAKTNNHTTEHTIISHSLKPEIFLICATDSSASFIARNRSDLLACIAGGMLDLTEN